MSFENKNVVSEDEGVLSLSYDLSKEVAEDIPILRRHFCQISSQEYLSENQIRDASLIITELAANAHKHGPDGFAELFVMSDEIVVFVQNTDASKQEPSKDTVKSKHEVAKLKKYDEADVALDGLCEIKEHLRGLCMVESLLEKHDNFSLQQFNREDQRICVFRVSK